MSVPLEGVTINGVEIENSFAEGFSMTATRILITAVNSKWAMHAAQSMTGFSTSVIGCGVEGGIECQLSREETPDRRPGVAVLLFALSIDELARQLAKRVGQCVLTCPTTAVFSGFDSGQSIAMGDSIRYFGDGYQIAKRIGDRRFWRIPVMDGEFLCESHTRAQKAVGGGNFLVMARTQVQALQACEAAIESIQKLPRVIMPFPGGGVRSGSKVGSKYKNLDASTHEAYCPSVAGVVDSYLHPRANAAMEIVVDALSVQDVIDAMRAGIHTVCALGLPQGILAISAGNYGGRLGKHHFHLWEIAGDTL